MTSLSPPHSYYNSNTGTGRPYSTALTSEPASPGAIANATLTEICAMPPYGDESPYTPE